MYSLEINWEDKCLTQFNKKKKKQRGKFQRKREDFKVLAYRGFSYEIIKNALKEFD